jgi:hypothetical protein
MIMRCGVLSGVDGSELHRAALLRRDVPMNDFRLDEPYRESSCERVSRHKRSASPGGCRCLGGGPDGESYGFVQPRDEAGVDCDSRGGIVFANRVVRLPARADRPVTSTGTLF